MSSLEEAFAQDALILTPNSPLSQKLRRQRLLHMQVCSAPRGKIDVLTNWLKESINPVLPIATDSQLAYIWEQLIAEKRDRNNQLNQLNPGFLTSRALLAWRNLKRWQISYNELENAETGQLISFVDWAQDFEKRLKQASLTSLELEVIEGLCSANQAKSARVSLYGFIEPVAPLWRAWLEQHFDLIEDIAFDSKAAAASICPRESPEHELNAALHWVNSTLQENPKAKIAIIDTNLQKNMKACQRLADRLMGNTPKRFSKQVPLSNQGPVQTALALIKLNLREIDLATARLICQSPHWGVFPEAYETRAQWDSALCALRLSRIKCADFIALTSDIEAEKTAELLNKTFLDRNRAKQMLPLDWADIFQQQLMSLGCFEACADFDWGSFTVALDEFSALGILSGEIAVAEALRQLNLACNKASAKASSATQGLNFLDTVEAAADYSHIWIMGMDSQNWPGTPNPNPLLPVSLQIKHQMPRSNAAAETIMAAKLVERLKQATEEIVFSYAQQSGDLQLSPCSFVSDLPVVEVQPPQGDIDIDPARLEWLDCSTAPRVPDEEREVQAGAGLLKTMASSPFDAFAYWRLNAQPLDEPKIGFDARDRGILVHHLLERVWQELKDSEGLSTHNDEQLRSLCETAADDVLRKYQHRHGWQNQAFVAMEGKRISELVFAWISVERQRDEFQVNLSEEQLQADIGGLRFKLRLDRLDRLNDGKLLLIDYKTGSNLGVKYWLEMPPPEPQLPLYALTLDQAPDAICFARVHKDGLRFIGIGRESYVDGIAPVEDWQQLVKAWRDSLEDLAKNYIQGDTRVFGTKPMHGSDDPLTGLHRFNETDQLNEYRALFKPVEQQS